MSLRKTLHNLQEKNAFLSGVILNLTNYILNLTQNNMSIWPFEKESFNNAKVYRSINQLEIDLPNQKKKYNPFECLQILANFMHQQHTRRLETCI